MKTKSKIYWFETIFFLFFGIFHLHKIWGLFDRNRYATYWLSVMTNKDIIYYLLMIILITLCIVGIIVFIKSKSNNYWWRWIYIFGGGYVLFDISAITLEISWWNSLLQFMFDVNNPYWNIIWGLFILMGLLSFVLGLYIFKLNKQS